jgi:hypothetical protein
MTSSSAADVAELELLLLEHLLLGVASLGVAAELDAAARVDLRHAEGHDLVAQLGLLAGREDHAGVGHAEAQDRDQPLEVMVVTSQVLLVHRRPTPAACAES